MSEWSIELVLKTSRGDESLEGSNPSPTAKYNCGKTKMETPILEWKTREFEHYEKGSGWYVTLWALAFLVIAYSFYLRDYFAALTLFVIALVVYFFSKQMPGEVDVMITDKAIMLNDTRFAFRNIRNFWIVDHDISKALHFETTAYLNREIIVLLDNIEPEKVRQALKRFLPETEENYESAARRIARKLRF